MGFSSFDRNRQFDTFFVFGTGAFPEYIVFFFRRFTVFAMTDFEVKKISDDLQIKIAVPASRTGNF